MIAETVRGLLPTILAHKIATEEEIRIDTLAQRCREVAISQRGVVMGPDIVSAWTCIEYPSIDAVLPSGYLQPEGSKLGESDF